MLTIIVPAMDHAWDERIEEFVTCKEQELRLEHSLVSISKWESKWCKPFLSKDKKTPEEVRDYVKCMTLTQNVPDDVYYRLTKENFEAINRYIEAPMTATTIWDDGHAGGRQIVTSELIYYWMIALNVPFECQKLHLNRLLMLIRVCNEKNKPQKKMNQRAIMSRNAKLNEERRRMLGTSG